MKSADDAPRADARAWWGLPFLLLPALLTSMDISVLFVASPAIVEALAPTATQWLWSMDVYGFVMAGLLITMGGLGDRIGRKKLLLVGSVLFGAASAATAFAPTAELLVVARALLGVGAATLAPSTLSLIRSTFAVASQRRAAIGAWTVAFTGGAVAGPIVGGVLLEYFWWGSVFLINVPVMILLLLTVGLLIDESRDPRPGSFDLAGAFASLVAVVGFVFAVKHVFAGAHAADDGLDLTAAAALLTSGGFLAIFLWRQRRAARPLVDIGLLRRPAFGAAVAANTAVSFSTGGLGLLAFTFLQTVHDLSPLRAALWALPTFAGTFLGVTLAAGLATRIRVANLLCAGLLLGAAGFVIVGLAGAALPGFIGGYTVLAFGIGIVGTLANTLILATAPPERAGTAAGLSETSSELGAALGIATLGTIATAVYQSAMNGRAETVAGAVAAAERLPTPAAEELLDRAFAAFTASVDAAALTGAAILTLVAVFAAVALRGHPSTNDDSDDVRQVAARPT